MSKLVWQYGVTTIPSRRYDYLPKTLSSLKAGGFSFPQLFLDGEHEQDSPNIIFSIPVTQRNTPVKVSGNWWLAIWELYIRNPTADRYAIFQDDMICYRNLKEFLEKTQYPFMGYQNLYTAPSNESFAADDGTGKPRIGWYETRNCNKDTTIQTGRGAVGLVFSNDALVTLLSSPHMLRRFKGPKKDCNIDGGIAQAMNEAGYREYVHYPSLIQHCCILSSFAKVLDTDVPAIRTQSASFRGESFDALTLL